MDSTRGGVAFATGCPRSRSVRVCGAGAAVLAERETRARAAEDLRGLPGLRLLAMAGL
jgi:hypothetical protein